MKQTIWLASSHELQGASEMFGMPLSPLVGAGKISLKTYSLDLIREMHSITGSKHEQMKLHVYWETTAQKSHPSAFMCHLSIIVFVFCFRKHLKFKHMLKSQGNPDGTHKQVTYHWKMWRKIIWTF